MELINLALSEAICETRFPQVKICIVSLIYTDNAFRAIKLPLNYQNV